MRSIAPAWLSPFVSVVVALLATTPIAGQRVLHARVEGPSAVQRPPLVYLDDNDSGDVFTYDPVTGIWSREVSNPGGGFTQQSQGSWSPGWSILRADFNTDALTDFFLYNKATGQWAKMLNDGTGFTMQSTGGWNTGWERYAMNLDGDGITDLFVHDPVGGGWYKCISTPTGFSYTRGGWNPGWEVYLTNFNGDGLDDLFLISRTTGRWFWALGENGPGFTYPVTETWFPGWALYPGDFNGDALTDLFGHDPVSGTYFTALTNASGFTYQFGAWSLGWTPLIADLDGNDRDDVFLHDEATGAWLEMLSDGAGNFANAGGQTWSLGWRLYPSDFNFDGREDLVLYNPQTGAWHQARNVVNATFDYTGGKWQPGLSLVTRRTNRPECSAFVTFESPAFPAAGGSISGLVTTSEPDCSWSLSVESGLWLQIFPRVGTGSARVLAIATTTSSPGSAAIRLGQQQLSMTKAGEPNQDRLGIDGIYCGQVVPNNAPPFYEFWVLPRAGKNPISTGIQVTVDLTVFGRSAHQSLYYSYGVWEVDLGIPASFPKGLVMLTFRVTDAQGRVVYGTAPLIVK